MKEMLIRKLVSAFQMIGTTRPMGIMQANVMINGQEFVGILNATNEILFNLGPDSEYWSQLMPTLTSYLGGAQMLTTLFRVPAIGLAMYHTAYAKNKKIAKGVILTCCLCETYQ